MIYWGWCPANSSILAHTACRRCQLFFCLWRGDLWAWGTYRRAGPWVAWAAATGLDARTPSGKATRAKRPASRLLSSSPAAGSRRLQQTQKKTFKTGKKLYSLIMYFHTLYRLYLIISHASYTCFVRDKTFWPSFSCRCLTSKTWVLTIRNTNNGDTCLLNYDQGLGNP